VALLPQSCTTQAVTSVHLAYLAAQWWGLLAAATLILSDHTDPLNSISNLLAAIIVPCKKKLSLFIFQVSFIYAKF
jgi:hypothetical protein